jgi:transposase
VGNPAGVRRDFEKLEQRRLEAAELLRQGIHQAAVARRVGVHRQSVSRWAQELEQGGKRALRKAGRAGRRPRLHPSLWTCWRVADLIERECGVKYHPTQAWRIMRQLGWSCQRRVGCALEREEDKIRRWKQERWPEIKKKPKNRAVPSSSSTKAD